MKRNKKKAEAHREAWTQSDGAGVLQVCGDVSAVALVVNGAPLIVDFHDGGGSIGRFTFLVDDAQPELTAQIESRAASGFAEESPLNQQLEPLLALLSNGDYVLTLAKLERETVVLSFDEYDSVTGRSLWYYPWFKKHETYSEPVTVLVYTQWECGLSDQIIERYIVAINDGQRPALITIGAKGHSARFLLDGHHKMSAYGKCGVVPMVLHIEAQTMSPLPAQLSQTVTPQGEDLLPRLEKAALEGAP